jgi:hypothetical protein
MFWKYIDLFYFSLILSTMWVNIFDHWSLQTIAHEWRSRRQLLGLLWCFPMWNLTWSTIFCTRHDVTWQYYLNWYYQTTMISSSLADIIDLWLTHWLVLTKKSLISTHFDQKFDRRAKYWLLLVNRLSTTID